MFFFLLCNVLMKPFANSVIQSTTFFFCRENQDMSLRSGYSKTCYSQDVCLHCHPVFCNFRLIRYPESWLPLTLNISMQFSPFSVEHKIFIQKIFTSLRTNVCLYFSLLHFSKRIYSARTKMLPLFCPSPSRKFSQDET